MRRSRVIALIGLAVILFVVISGLLARAFSVAGAEDSAITDLVKAEAAGNANGVVSLIYGCRADPVCRARADQVSSALKQPGTVQILEIQPSSGFSLSATMGIARVAWLAGSSRPRVQCLRVRHTGDVLAGFTVRLIEVSPQITSDSDCPSRF
jgi:hypothetical protein